MGTQWQALEHRSLLAVSCRVIHVRYRQCMVRVGVPLTSAGRGWIGKSPAPPHRPQLTQEAIHTVSAGRLRGRLSQECGQILAPRELRSHQEALPSSSHRLMVQKGHSQNLYPLGREILLTKARGKKTIVAK